MTHIVVYNVLSTRVRALKCKFGIAPSLFGRLCGIPSCIQIFFFQVAHIYLHIIIYYNDGHIVLTNAMTVFGALIMIQ